MNMIDDHDLDSFSMNSSSTNTEVGSEVIRYPGEHDVLFGRGGAINQHVGNIMFRKIVNEQKDDYFNAPKCEKPKIARRVVAIVRDLNPPGRFLAPLYESDRNCKDSDGKILWHDVGDKKARAKASQCLREKKLDPPYETPTRKSSTIKKRKKVAQEFSLRSCSSYSDKVAESGNGQANSFSHRRRQNVTTRIIPNMYNHCSQEVTKISSNAPNDKYYTEWWKYHQNEVDLLSNHKKQRVAHTVTPCFDTSKRPKICEQREMERHEDYGHRYHHQRQQQKKVVGTESDLSWIGSFCSLETQLIEEGEKASLSPQITQMPLIIPKSDNQTLPVVFSATSWTGSDVGSELTDNSHVEDFD